MLDVHPIWNGISLKGPCYSDIPSLKLGYVLSKDLSYNKIGQKGGISFLGSLFHLGRKVTFGLKAWISWRRTGIPKVIQLDETLQYIFAGFGLILFLTSVFLLVSAHFIYAFQENILTDLAW